MRSLVLLVATTALALCLAVTLVEGARAHAIVVSSGPADGGAGAPPHRLRLRLNGRIDKTLCSVMLVGSRETHVLLLRQETAEPDTLAYTMPPVARDLPGQVEGLISRRSSDAGRSQLYHEAPVTQSRVRLPEKMAGKHSLVPLGRYR
jgi:methionine-rich copper-binding protein CopC